MGNGFRYCSSRIHKEKRRAATIRQSEGLFTGIAFDKKERADEKRPEAEAFR